MNKLLELDLDPGLDPDPELNLDPGLDPGLGRGRGRGAYPARDGTMKRKVKEIHVDEKKRADGSVHTAIYKNITMFRMISDSVIEFDHIVNRATGDTERICTNRSFKIIYEQAQASNVV